MKAKIFTFGDSHSLHFPEYVIKNYLGAVLAYSIGRDGIDLLDITNKGIEDNDHVIFCFGEIDCRCQVYKYHDKNDDDTYKHNIKSLVKSYFDTIKLNQDKLNKNINIWIYNVVPTVRNGAFIEHPDDAYPLLGTNDERKNYFLYMNKTMKEKCLDYGFEFFDIYDKYTDEGGFLKDEYRDSLMHVQDVVYIDEFINNNIKL